MNIQALIGKEQHSAHQAVLQSQSAIVTQHLLHEKEMIQNQIDHNRMSLAAQKDYLSEEEYKIELEKQQEKERSLQELQKIILDQVNEDEEMKSQFANTTFSDKPIPVVNIATAQVTNDSKTENYNSPNQSIQPPGSANMNSMDMPRQDTVKLGGEYNDITETVNLGGAKMTTQRPDDQEESTVEQDKKQQKPTAPKIITVAKPRTKPSDLSSKYQSFNGRQKSHEELNKRLFSDKMIKEGDPKTPYLKIDESKTVSKSGSKKVEIDKSFTVKSLKSLSNFGQIPQEFLNTEVLRFQAQPQVDSALWGQNTPLGMLENKNIDILYQEQRHKSRSVSSTDEQLATSKTRRGRVDTDCDVNKKKSLLMIEKSTEKLITRNSVIDNLDNSENMMIQIIPKAPIDKQQLLRKLSEIQKQKKKRQKTATTRYYNTRLSQIRHTETDISLSNPQLAINSRQLIASKQKNRESQHVEVNRSSTQHSKKGILRTPRGDLRETEKDNEDNYGFANTSSEMKIINSKPHIVLMETPMVKLPRASVDSIVLKEEDQHSESIQVKRQQTQGEMNLTHESSVKLLVPKQQEETSELHDNQSIPAESPIKEGVQTFIDSADISPTKTLRKGQSAALIQGNRREKQQAGADVVSHASTLQKSSINLDVKNNNNVEPQTPEDMKVSLSVNLEKDVNKIKFKQNFSQQHIKEQLSNASQAQQSGTREVDKESSIQIIIANQKLKSSGMEFIKLSPNQQNFILLEQDRILKGVPLQDKLLQESPKSKNTNQNSNSPIVEYDHKNTGVGTRDIEEIAEFQISASFRDTSRNNDLVSLSFLTNMTDMQKLMMYESQLKQAIDLNQSFKMDSSRETEPIGSALEERLMTHFGDKSKRSLLQGIKGTLPRVIIKNTCGRNKVLMPFDEKETNFASSVKGTGIEVLKSSKARLAFPVFNNRYRTSSKDFIEKNINDLSRQINSKISPQCDTILKRNNFGTEEPTQTIYNVTLADISNLGGFHTGSSDLSSPKNDLGIGNQTYGFFPMSPLNSNYAPMAKIHEQTNEGSDKAFSTVQRQIASKQSDTWFSNRRLSSNADFPITETMQKVYENNSTGSPDKSTVLNRRVSTRHGNMSQISNNEMNSRTPINFSQGKKSTANFEELDQVASKNKPIQDIKPVVRVTENSSPFGDSSGQVTNIREVSQQQFSKEDDYNISPSPKQAIKKDIERLTLRNYQKRQSTSNQSGMQARHSSYVMTEYVNNQSRTHGSFYTPNAQISNKIIKSKILTKSRNPRATHRWTSDERFDKKGNPPDSLQSDPSQDRLNLLKNLALTKGYSNRNGNNSRDSSTQMEKRVIDAGNIWTPQVQIRQKVSNLKKDQQRQRLSCESGLLSKISDKFRQTFSRSKPVSKVSSAVGVIGLEKWSNAIALQQSNLSKNIVTPGREKVMSKKRNPKSSINHGQEVQTALLNESASPSKGYENESTIQRIKDPTQTVESKLSLDQNGKKSQIVRNAQTSFGSLSDVSPQPQVSPFKVVGKKEGTLTKRETLARRKTQNQSTDRQDLQQYTESSLVTNVLEKKSYDPHQVHHDDLEEIKIIETRQSREESREINTSPVSTQFVNKSSRSPSVVLQIRTSSSNNINIPKASSQVRGYIVPDVIDEITDKQRRKNWKQYKNDMVSSHYPKTPISTHPQYFTPNRRESNNHLRRLQILQQKALMIQEAEARLPKQRQYKVDSDALKAKLNSSMLLRNRSSGKFNHSAFSSPVPTPHKIMRGFI